MKVSILGAGTWGTALAILLANNQHEVTIWSKVKRIFASFTNMPAFCISPTIPLTTLPAGNTMLSPTIISDVKIALNNF